VLVGAQLQIKARWDYSATPLSWTVECKLLESNASIADILVSVDSQSDVNITQTYIPVRGTTYHLRMKHVHQAIVIVRFKTQQTTYLIEEVYYEFEITSTSRRSNGTPTWTCSRRQLRTYNRAH
jgi:hypothetical protein